MGVVRLPFAEEIGDSCWEMLDASRHLLAGPWHRANDHRDRADYRMGHGADCPACLARSWVNEVIAEAIDGLAHLRAITATRAVRRAQPDLTDAVAIWAADMAGALRGLAISAKDGPLTNSQFIDFASSFQPLLGRISAALDEMPANEDDDGLVGRGLSRLEDIASRVMVLALQAIASVLAHLKLRTSLVSIESALSCSADPGLRPGTGSRVPHGPPTTGFGPRLCRAA